MKDKTLCPICGDGQISHQTRKVEQEFNGSIGLVDLHFSVCDSCGCEMALDKDLKANSRSMNEFRRERQGLLSGCQIATIRINEWKISQKDASLVFGGGAKSFNKYESGDVVQSSAMDKLIKVASKYPDVFYYLCEEANLKIDEASIVNEKKINEIYSKNRFHSARDHVLMVESSAIGVVNLMYMHGRIENHINESHEIEWISPRKKSKKLKTEFAFNEDMENL